MRARRSVSFLPVDGAGGRFCVLTEPPGEPRGAVLYVHPFAEEMNKSRRMAALAAQEFATRGWLVLQIDLHGCGDSSDDFGDASWADWLTDIDAAWRWLEGRGVGTVCLWSLRAGSLVIADWIKTRGTVAPLLLWQPVIDGRQHLTQFLRLKGVSQMMEESDAKTAIAKVKAELESGQSVEVAGYTLSPNLVTGLQGARLELPTEYPAPVALLEVGGAEGGLSPGLVALAQRWEARGIKVTHAGNPGPAFWQTLEIEVAPALIDASSSVLEGFPT